MRHLLLAPLDASFGEALHGARLAQQLVSAGDEVTFLGRAAVQPVLDGIPVRFGCIDEAMARLDHHLLVAAAGGRFDSFVLVDRAAVYKVFEHYRLAESVLPRLAPQLVALDAWNLPLTGLSWDYGPEDYVMKADALGPLRSLLPVPFLAPADAGGSYNALPELSPSSAAQRRGYRAQLGLSDSQRLVVWAQSTWQLPEAHQNPQRQTMATAVPQLMLEYLSMLGDDVQVAHVAARACPAAQVLGARYRCIPLMAPSQFAQLLAAADLYVTYNLTATSLAMALCLQLPTLVLHNSQPAARAEVPLPGVSSPRVMAWRKRYFTHAPLLPFWAAPLSLHRFLQPVLQRNPLLQAVCPVEILNEEAVVAAMRGLMWEPETVDSHQAASARYVAQVRALPTAAERLYSYLR
jgi:hypothetical protein